MIEVMSERGRLARLSLPPVLIDPLEIVATWGSHKFHGLLYGALGQPIVPTLLDVRVTTRGLGRSNEQVTLRSCQQPGDKRPLGSFRDG
jgi:hypothetical protein